MLGAERLTVVEYGSPSHIPATVLTRLNVDADEARHWIEDAGERTRRALGLKSALLHWGRKGFRFSNVAGVFRVVRGLEVEVAPKCLGDVQGWRDDFFLLATLSEHGRLLGDDGIRASMRSRSDLHTLVGRALVSMYWKNLRRPLRAYRRVQVDDYSIEGDFEPEELIRVAEDGFRQEVNQLTRANRYSATIRQAAQKLAREVGDLETRLQLERVIHHVPQMSEGRGRGTRPLPRQSRSWEGVYRLAQDVLRDLGGTYDAGSLVAPGFLVKTWQMWERLVMTALRAAFGAEHVSVHQVKRLGTRRSAAGERSLTVVPDGAVWMARMQRRIVVDAKYKGSTETSGQIVEQQDIYEALAYARAFEVQEVVLVYPGGPEDVTASESEAGVVRRFAEIRVGELKIVGVSVGVTGIAKADGVRRFVAGLREGILEAVENATTWTWGTVGSGEQERETSR